MDKPFNSSQSGMHTFAGAFDASIELNHIGKQYGARRVLRDISIEASSRDLIIVAGPNGSGKSTLLKIIAGLLRPTRGEVTFSINKKMLNSGERRRAVGYAAPDLALYPELSAHENLSFFTQVRGLTYTSAGIERRLDKVGLNGRGSGLVSTFSSGMRQRLRLAFALLADPPVLLLDEPSATLDETGVELVNNIIANQREMGGIVFLATNDPREMKLGEITIDLHP